MTLYYTLKNGQDGNKKAVKDVYLKFYPNIKKLSRSLYYEEGETDLTIALLELIKNINLEKFKKDDKEINKFIYKFIKNKAIDLHRKNVVNKKVFLPINYNNLYDEKIPDFNSNIFISFLLNHLPTMQRIVIIERFIYQYSDREISQILGISRQAVNRLKNRGLNNLKKVLQEL